MMARWWRTFAAACLCLAPAGAMGLPLGTTPVIVLVGAVCAALATGWTDFTRIPGRPSAIVLLALAALADVAVVTVGAGGAGALEGSGGAGALAVVLGLAIPVAFVREIARGGQRTGLVDSVSAVVTGLVALGAASLWACVAVSEAGLLIALVIGVLGAVGVGVTRPWNHVEGPPVWADLARVSLPMAGIAPMAWLASLALG